MRVVSLHAPLGFMDAASAVRAARLPDGPVPLAGGAAPAVVELLRAEGHEVVALAALTRDPTAARSLQPAAHADILAVELALEPEERVAVLVEIDGVCSWHYPDHRPAAAPRSVDLRVPVAARRPAASRGAITDAIVERVTAWALRFVVRAAVDVAVERLEAGAHTGLVDLLDPAAMTRPAELAPLRAIAGRTPRVLLFVHGTFGSCEAHFGPLRATAGGAAFLEQARRDYDAVLGYDHRTLSVTPDENARACAAELFAAGWATPPRVDLLGFSRGGLVARCLAAELEGRASVGTTVFVACTNGGTHLAEPENWRHLVDLVTNVAAATGALLALLAPGAAVAAAVGPVLKGVAALVQHLAAVVVEERRVPGLAAMRPGSELIRELGARRFPGTLRAVSSDFSGRVRLSAPREAGRELALAVADRVADALFAAPNDLVVDTASMTDLGASAIHERLAFAPASGVFHGNYFTHGALTAKLALWLGVPRATPRTVPPTGGGPQQGGGPPAPMDDWPPVAGGLPPMMGGPSTRTGGVAPGSATVDPRVRCHVAAEIDAEVVVDTTATVTVSLSRGELALTPGTAGTMGTASVDPERRVIVDLVGKRNFTAAGARRAEVAVPPAGQTTTLYFDVTARQVGTGELWIVFRQGTDSLATLSLAPKIVAAPAPAPGPGRLTADAVATHRSGRRRAAHRLTIYQTTVRGETSLSFELDSAAVRSVVLDDITIERDIPAYVARLYEEIEKTWTGAAADLDVFQLSLEALGRRLYKELVPPLVQQALWQHRDALDAIQVYSEEPFIPWELLFLSPPPGAAPDDGRFFGEMGLVRWLHNKLAPAEVLPVRPGRARYLIPAYAPPYTLPATALEREFLVAQFAATPLAPRARQVIDALRAPGGFDLLHFAGHGDASPHSPLDARVMLEGTVVDQQLVPEYLGAAVVAELAAVGEEDGARPLVVLNACRAGQAAVGLTRLGGFAEAFLSARAGAFVGASWAIGDHPAFVFGRTLYERLRAGDTLARASVAARRAARAQRDATWLAYVVYGHPDATMSIRS